MSCHYLILVLFTDTLLFQWIKRMNICQPDSSIHLLCDRQSVKRVSIRSYSALYFSWIFPHSDWIQRDSPYSVQMRENPGKMQTRITPNTDSFYTVCQSEGAGWIICNFGRSKYFCCSAWSIYCNCSHIITQTETYCGYYFIAVHLIGIKLFFWYNIM